MAKSIDARLACLEAPRGDLHHRAAHSYAMLNACYAILCHLDDEPMPTDAELMAMAQAEAASGHALDYTRALELVWEAQR
jgi:hypothetical protein